MDNKALYILAGYDDETGRRLQAIQDKLYEEGFTGTQTKNIPMHTTMGSFPTDMEEELKAKLIELSETVPAFDVSFSHVGMFSGARVLFVAPDASHKMLELKEKFGDSFGWARHTTMLIDDPEVIYKALPIVMEEFSSFKGKMSRLYLYEFFPTRHILTVELK